MKPQPYTEITPTAWHSYAGVERLMYNTSGEWRAKRPLQRNTYLIRNNHGITLYSHKSPLITWDKNDTIRLDAGGIYSLTGRERLNTYLPNPLKIVVKRGYWHVSGVVTTDETGMPRKSVVPFNDGMEIDLHTHRLLTPEYDLEPDIQYNRQLNQRLSGWADRWVEMLTAAGLNAVPESAMNENATPSREYMMECIVQGRYPYPLPCKVDRRASELYRLRDSRAARKELATRLRGELTLYLARGPYTGKSGKRNIESLRATNNLP